MQAVVFEISGSETGSEPDDFEISRRRQLTRLAGRGVKSGNDCSITG